MEGWQRFLDKKIKVVFDDGKAVSIKFGILKECNNSYLLLKTSQGEDAISVSRIVRVERSD